MFNFYLKNVRLSATPPHPFLLLVARKGLSFWGLTVTRALLWLRRGLVSLFGWGLQKKHINMPVKKFSLGLNNPGHGFKYTGKESVSFLAISEKKKKSKEMYRFLCQSYLLKPKGFLVRHLRGRFQKLWGTFMKKFINNSLRVLKSSLTRLETKFPLSRWLPRAREREVPLPFYVGLDCC